MKIKVKAYMTIKKAMGDEAVLEMEMDNATLGGLLEELFNRYGKVLRDLIFDPETKKVRSHNQICVNTRHYIFLQDQLDTELKDGDVVALIPPVAGG